MELTSAVIIVMFTILIPINGAMLLGMINERKKMRRILMGMWRVQK